jgi:hypothetical protein
MIHDRSVIRVKPDPEVRILAFSFMSASITRSSWRAKLKIGNVFGLEAIQGAGSTRSRAFHDMEVDHGGGDVGMAEKVLDGADVGAGFEQVRGELMAKDVRCDAVVSEVDVRLCGGGRRPREPGGACAGGGAFGLCPARAWLGYWRELFHNPFRVGHSNGAAPGVVPTPGFRTESLWDS